MLNIENRTGASAMSRAAHRNPLEVLARLVKDDRSADADRLFSKWSEEMREDDDLLEAALRHAFTNMLASIDRDQKRAVAVRSAPQTKTAQRVHVEALKSKIRQVVLLDIELPNGKRLREATFADCRLAGGWFIKVAKKGRGTAVVGETLNEADLQRIRFG